MGYRSYNGVVWYVRKCSIMARSALRNTCLVIGDGETSCRKTVGWRIVLSIGNLVLLVLWSGSMDDRCDPVTQTIHLPRQQLHSIRIICGQYDQLHSRSYIPKCRYI